MQIKIEKNNKLLQKILTELNLDISYDFLYIVCFAFLKENNETLKTLQLNEEFKLEFKSYVKQLLKDSNPDICQLIKTYNKLD
jgi:hypothetical protein